jgi:isocitrate/isopropylmalate dehydrogenase
MAKYKIASLPGDGIGNEVMEACQLVLDAMKLDAEYVHGDIGWEYWKSEGNPLPERTLEVLRNTDAALFGAITSLPKEEAEHELKPELQGKGLEYFSPIVRLRQEFNLHTNLRPCKAFPGNTLNYRDDIDLVVFRENTEGLYVGVEFHPVPQEVMDVLVKYNKKAERFAKNKMEDIAISTRLFTKAGCRSIVTQGFEYAKKHGYKTVTIVEKPNVLRETSGMMVRIAREVAKNYPGIDLWEANIDAMTMWLIKNPDQYGVLVAGNMFGDIISDLCAQLVGGLGFAASGNIGDNYAVFEPTHGSAPKYYGQYKVNPIAMILCGKMMLDWLGETEMASKLEKAIAATIAEGEARTYDMGGSAGTMDVAKAIAAKL